MFCDEWYAESTLEYLNDNFEDCYSIIQLPSKPFAVKYTVSGTVIVDADDEDDAIAQVENLSMQEILENVAIALNGDSYEVSSAEELDE